MQKGQQNLVRGWQRTLSVLAALGTGPWEPQAEVADEAGTEVGLHLGERPSAGYERALGLVAAGQ